MPTDNCQQSTILSRQVTLLMYELSSMATNGITISHGILLPVHCLVKLTK